MPFYRTIGDVPRKRHTQHRGPDGALRAEELMGQAGFGSNSALLYHRFSPSALVDARPWQLPDQTTTPNLPLLPRHLRLHDLFGQGQSQGQSQDQSQGQGQGPGQDAAVDPVTGRRLLLGNADVRISYAVSSLASPLYRNATGDECLYIEAGSALLETVFGALQVGRGDYVLVPGGTIHRWVPAGDEPLRTYIIEASSHIGPPRRYSSPAGQLLEHSPYCERDLRGPAEPLLAEGSEVEVYVKHGAAGTVHVLARHPFDVVGWDGCLYPYVFNIADFEPITGRIHQPPPAHQVFEGTGFVVCNFVPRKVDYHPLSIPVPYYHSNVDSDEVMFYVDGDYQARRGSGIGKGSVSLHPAGYTHGPQPGAVERSLGVAYVDELAVMVDTFRPLGLGEGGRAVDDGRYAWAGGPRPR